MEVSVSQGHKDLWYSEGLPLIYSSRERDLIHPIFLPYSRNLFVYSFALVVRVRVRG